MAIGFYDSDTFHNGNGLSSNGYHLALSQQSDARVYLSTVEGNRGEAPEYEGKLDSLVADVEGFAFLQDRGLVQQQLEEKGEGEDNPIPEEKMDRPGLQV